MADEPGRSPPAASGLEGIRILHLEDDASDGELIERELALAGGSLAVLRVSSREDFLRALESWKPDVILSDFNMPGFDGLTALALARARCPEVPYISVSGAIGEHLAVELLKKGASDYVLKDRLEKLPLAIRRALTESRERLRLHEAEQALREREEQYRLLVEEMPGVLYVARPDAVGSTVYVSPQVERLLGFTQEEWIGDPGLWARRLHPEDRDRVLSGFARTAAAGQGFDVEYRLVARDGRALWFHDRAQLVRMGEMLVRGIRTDITERKRLEEQFLQAQKMEAVGRLAGGVAHDFNNLLTVITGYGDLVLSRLGPDDPNRARIQEIYDAGVRAASLTRQLLAFSRRQIVERRMLDLNAVVLSLSKMLGRLVGDDIEIRTEPGAGLDRVLCDPGQAEQVLVNLVVNARDAMPQGGTIRIATRNADAAEEFVAGEVERRPGRHVMLSVSDTGTGIPAEVKARLFEPFFTTKAPGKGTGLGLSTVQAIVKQFGGCVSLESEPGKGATFKVFLPRTEEKGTEKRPAPPPAGIVRGTETVLVAEDSEMLLRLTEEILKSAGYTVLAARDGETAWRLFQERRGSVDLVLTDTVMPGLGGAELIARAIREKPGIRVLLMSGYTEPDAAEHGVPASGVPFLEKPFNAEKLTRRVREVLEAPAPAAC